ncbi:MAG: DUF438 domain-containing protein [Bacillota bacterium]
MSQEINNREYRKNVIKDLLYKLHSGKTVDEVKQEFSDAFSGVSAAEISEAEQALISEGVSVSEVQRLCDVHSAVFKGSIQEIHAPADLSQIPGHPAHTLKAENRALERLISERIRPGLTAVLNAEQPADRLLEPVQALMQIDRHYLRKENLFFPYMERYGITAPPKVMWGVDDEIRSLIKQAAALAASNDKAVVEKLNEALTRVEEMIFKEENILLPMLLETLTQQEWKNIASESAELGYCLIEAPAAWLPAETNAASAPAKPEGNAVAMPTGFLSPKELTHLLDTLPMDITFVGKDDTVRYFSQGTERVFPRTRAIIGRKVSNCHPPASVHIVEGIVEDLKSGKKSHEDFWIHMGGKYVFIRYFAVRDENGEYLGTLEVTQDIAPIQQITGEKRLVSE